MGRRHPLEVRLHLGRKLLAGVPRGQQKRMAEHERVSDRTVRNWKRLAADEAAGQRRPPGRPGYSVQAWAAARERVAAVLERVGYRAGEALVHEQLDKEVPLGLVRRVLRELKTEHEGRKRRALEAVRTHVVVHGRNVMWSVDGTHLGRDPENKAVIGEVVRDVASTSTLGLSAGPPPTSGEVVALLDHVASETGELPLVLASDNGGENKGEVDAWCERHGVVRLRNLPYTPQHNPWVEHGNRELKQESGLGKGVALDSKEVALSVLIEAVERIDTRIPRATRGWRTAREAYAELPAGHALIDRQGFLNDAHCAIERALQDCTSSRARRLAEREAVLGTMERCELITRTRGRATKRPQKPEGVS